MFVALKTYNTIEMIALAYAVDRINKGYVKFSNSTAKSNKDIFMGQIAKIDQPQYFTDVAEVVVTDVDREAATQVEKKLSHMILKSIKGFDNTFEQNMYNAVFKDSVTRNNLPMISFVPEFVRRETQQKTTTREIVNNYSESVHMTSAKDAVGVAKILRAIYMSNFEKYMYVAVTEAGNLIRFYIKEKFAVDDKIKITSCKIKNTEVDKITKMNVTLLNFVRFKRV